MKFSILILAGLIASSVDARSTGFYESIRLQSTSKNSTACDTEFRRNQLEQMAINSCLREQFSRSTCENGSGLFTSDTGGGWVMQHGPYGPIPDLFECNMILQWRIDY